MGRTRGALVWVALAVAIVVPLAAAAASPFLAWRQPVYVVAGFAGIVALAALLIQPLAVGGYLPGFTGRRGRRAHAVVGTVLVLAVVIHVGGLWITSPPDVVDALLVRSPTPFSGFGVLAMWAVFAAALLAAMRKTLRLPLRTWRIAHISLAAVTVVGTVIHAMLIEGAMETLSKAALCALVLLATARVIAHVWVASSRTRRKAL